MVTSHELLWICVWQSVSFLGRQGSETEMLFLRSLVSVTEFYDVDLLSTRDDSRS